MLNGIKALSGKIDRIVKIMHVCGTHEHVVCEHGLRSLLPENIEIIAGPGCPVCVCPASDIDKAIEISRQPNTILTTFGDMIRVPSSRQSLLEQKANGADIRVVYGPSEAIQIAKQNPDKEVVFFSIGFETTAPLAAFELYSGPPENFSILCAHKLIPPSMELIVSMPDVMIDGFITPGHVATIIGVKPFEMFSKVFRYPSVICGFEAVDILLSIFIILKQIYDGEYKTINEYSRIVKYEGNTKAQEIINEIFEVTTSPWRGIGRIPNGGYKIRQKYSDYDALERFDIDIPSSIDIPIGCSCHLVLTGKIRPEECKLFGKSCNPLNPIGPCMVSHEGTCRIAYVFRK
ncbi:MAG: hydrogenase formation protein HypD [Promethearchaeota archaeon]